MIPLQESVPPYIFLFKVNARSFCLDKHTNRIFILNHREAAILEKWQRGQSLKDLAIQYPREVAGIEALVDDGLFCSSPPLGLKYASDWDEICHRILHERPQTVIEITQACNLRCRYCTYGGGFPDCRTHTSTRMSAEMVKRSVDSALQHGDALEEITIGFYGGEPLLAFNLIEEAVLYSKSQTAKNVRFSVTTNATLIDRRIAGFFRKHSFSVLISIDGPRRLHDLFRVFRDGTGSYDAVVRGLKILQDVYPEELHPKIGLNMVIPSAEWILCLGELWDDEPWLSPLIHAQATPADIPAGLTLPPPPESEAGDPRHQWFASLGNENASGKNLRREYYERALVILHQRKICGGYRETFPQNGCCIPGARKVFIDAGGNYRMCERALSVPFIGSLDKGIDLMQIGQLIEEYSHASFADCRDCFAIPNCTLCYIHAYQGGKFSLPHKRETCNYYRKKSRIDLQYYGIINQDYAEVLEKWDDVKIV
jgi:uncharacterized protein